MDCFMIYCKVCQCVYISLKSNKIWLPSLLSYMGICEKLNVIDRWVLTSITLLSFQSLDSPKYFQLYMLVSSHINWLLYQTPGISNQALVFVRDIKMFTSRTDILAKSAIFDNTPAEKWFGPSIFASWNFLKDPISTLWDSFHGGESPSYDFFICVMDGQNANPKLITLWNVSLPQGTHGHHECQCPWSVRGHEAWRPLPAWRSSSPQCLPAPSRGSAAQSGMSAQPATACRSRIHL